MKSITVAAAAPPGGWGQVLALDPRFAPMVERLEATARRDPAGYRRRVVLAGLLGYVVLGGLMLLLGGAIAGLAALLYRTRTGAALEIKGMLALGLLLWGLVQALRVRPDPPEGFAVTTADAPALFAMLDRVRAAAHGPTIDEVRLTADLNAAITQRPRLLVFGARNTLYLGLPLLYALTTAEVEAVVAHELGHFVGRHGHSASFAYRLRLRWAQVAERLPDGVVAGLLRRFFGWYGPWFAAYSLVLARGQEFEADRISADVAGPRTAADALIRVAVQAERVGAVWTGIWDQASDCDDPPRSPMRCLAAALAVEPAEEADDRAALDRALAAPADLDDTHPTLGRRLDALGMAPTLPPALAAPAAAALLGDFAADAAARLDADWHETANPAWAERHAEVQRQRDRRAELEAVAAQGDADRTQLYDLAELTELLDGPAAATAAYARVLERFPQADDARYRQGDTLLDTGDAAGLALVLEAGRREPALAPHAYRRAIGFLHATGRCDEAEPYHALLADAEDAADAARREAGTISEAVALRPLPPELRERLLMLLAPVVGVRTLDAGLRDLRHAPQPQIVFLFTPEKGLTGEEALDALCEAMLPAGDLLGIEHGRNRRWLARRLAKLPGSRLVG